MKSEAQGINITVLFSRTKHNTQLVHRLNVTHKNIWKIKAVQNQQATEATSEASRSTQDHCYEDKAIKINTISFDDKCGAGHNHEIRAKLFNISISTKVQRQENCIKSCLRPGQPLLLLTRPACQLVGPIHDLSHTAPHSHLRAGHRMLAWLTSRTPLGSCIVPRACSRRTTPPPMCWSPRPA
jgi:hypothetical protein